MYAPPQSTHYVWVPSGHPPPPLPAQPLPVAAPPAVPLQPTAGSAFGGGWVYIPHPAAPALPPQSLPQPLPPMPLHPSGVPQPTLVPVPGYPQPQVSSVAHVQPPPLGPTEPSALVGTPPGAAPRLVPKQCSPGSTVTIPDCDKTWLDAETGAVNVRVLLLKSRDIRRKLRAALYHAGRPQYRLSANERAKASRCSEYAAMIRAIDAAARECGMLPLSEATILAHADALSLPRNRHARSRMAAVRPAVDDRSTVSGSAGSECSGDHSVRSPPTVPAEEAIDADMESQPTAWSMDDMRDVFLVTPGAPGLTSADEHFAAAHALYHRAQGAGAVTARSEIFAVLYRKFVIAAAAHIVALRSHRN